MKKLLFTLTTVLFLLFSSSSFADTKSLTFAWDQGGEEAADFAGWRLYESLTSGGPYTLLTQINFVTQQTEYTSASTISAPAGLVTTKYFILRAFNDGNQESTNSNEVSYIFDFTTIPSAPFNLIIKIVPSP